MYRIELYEQELKSTVKGRELLNIISAHAEELNQLINKKREVMVTWRRNRGAEFFAVIMGTGFNNNMVIKKEIAGITLSSLIRRMATVLQDHGSGSLIRAIDKYLLLVLSYAETCDSLQQIFQTLRNNG